MRSNLTGVVLQNTQQLYICSHYDKETLQYSTYWNAVFSEHMLVHCKQSTAEHLHYKEPALSFLICKVQGTLLCQDESYQLGSICCQQDLQTSWQASATHQDSHQQHIKTGISNTSTQASATHQHRHQQIQHINTIMKYR